MIVTAKLQLERQLSQHVEELNKAYGMQALVGLALESVQSLDCSFLLGQSPSMSGKGVNKKTLLTVLTYCYGVGIYNPSDIEKAIESDAAVSYLAARTYPSNAMLRHFRKEHRTALSESLVRFFERIWVAAELGVDPGQLGALGWTESMIRSEISAAILVEFGRLAEEHILLALLWDGPALRD